MYDILIIRLFSGFEMAKYKSSLEGAFSNVVSIIPSFLTSSVSAHRIRELVELPKEVHIPESSELDAYKDDGFSVKMIIPL